jgi:hypothetical protein
MIDVEQLCLVHVHGPVEYIALTYCWGSPEFVANVTQLRTDTAPLLFATNAFADDKHAIPNTNRDAISVTKALGQRYLWVDALCIMQDNKADKAALIGQMDKIYSNALLTIIAAGGDNVNTGLPGVREGSRTVLQKLGVLPTLKSASVPITKT